MGLSEEEVEVPLEAAGAGATVSKAGDVDEEEDEASADLFEEKGQTILKKNVGRSNCKVSQRW